MSWVPDVREIVLSLLLGSILIASIVNFNYPRFAENLVINVNAEYQNFTLADQEERGMLTCFE